MRAAKKRVGSTDSVRRSGTYIALLVLSKLLLAVNDKDGNPNNTMSAANTLQENEEEKSQQNKKAPDPEPETHGTCAVCNREQMECILRSEDDSQPTLHLRVQMSKCQKCQIVKMSKCQNFVADHGHNVTTT